MQRKKELVILLLFLFYCMNDLQQENIFCTFLHTSHLKKRKEMEKKKMEEKTLRKMNLEKILNDLKRWKENEFFSCNQEKKYCFVKELDKFSHIREDLGSYPRTRNTLPKGFWVRDEKQTNEFPKIWYLEKKDCDRECPNLQLTKPTEEFFKTPVVPAQTVVPYLSGQELQRYALTSKAIRGGVEKLPRFRLGEGKKCLSAFLSVKPSIPDLKYCFEEDRCSDWLDFYILSILSKTIRLTGEPGPTPIPEHGYFYLIDNKMQTNLITGQKFIEQTLSSMTSRWLISVYEEYDYESNTETLWPSMIKEEKKELDQDWRQERKQRLPYPSLHQICQSTFCPWLSQSTGHNLVFVIPVPAQESQKASKIEPITVYLGNRREDEKTFYLLKLNMAKLPKFSTRKGYDYFVLFLRTQNVIKRKEAPKRKKSTIPKGTPVIVID